MLLSKEVSFVSSIVFCLVIILACSILPDQELKEDFKLAVATSDTTSQLMQWDEHYASAGNASSAAVLLLRLQEIQAHLDTRQSAGALALSESLFALSLRVRQIFDGNLNTSYEQLSIKKKQSYTEVMLLIIDLEEMMRLAAGSGSGINVSI